MSLLLLLLLLLLFVFFLAPTDLWSEGRLRDFTGDACWLLLVGTFGGLETVVKVGGDFRPSTSGKLTVLQHRNMCTK
jgi:hypothetical protein